MSEALSLFRGVITIPRQITMKDLLRETAEDHNLDYAALMGDSRKQRIAHARHDFMWRARQIKNPDGSHRYTLPMIGRFLGGMDHTSIIHGVRAHARRMAEAQGRAA